VGYVTPGFECCRDFGGPLFSRLIRSGTARKFDLNGVLANLLVRERQNLSQRVGRRSFEKKTGPVWGAKNSTGKLKNFELSSPSI